MKKCPQCGREWSDLCEQAIWIERYDQCLACLPREQITRVELVEIGSEARARRAKIN